MNFKLNELLKKNRISQTELAKNLKVAPSLVNRYALQKLEPNYEMLCKIADYLHVTTDELLGRKTNNINLEVLPEDEKSLITKILSMNNVQKAQTINFVNALTMFDK